MENLKLYAKNDGVLAGLLSTEKIFRDDIVKQFGPEGCVES